VKYLRLIRGPPAHCHWLGSTTPAGCRTRGRLAGHDELCPVSGAERSPDDPSNLKQLSLRDSCRRIRRMARRRTSRRGMTSRCVIPRPSMACIGSGCSVTY